MGNFQFVRCPFGARNSCATFQREMNRIFAKGLYKRCVVYVDDILVFGRTRQEHDKNLNWVLSQCADYNVKFKLEKCKFVRSEVEYLGFVVSGTCIKPIESKVRNLKESRPPKDKTEFRSIVGRLNFYARFIPNYSKQLEPLRGLFQWEEHHQRAFDAIIQSLAETNLQMLVPRENHKILELHIMPDSIEALCLDDQERLINRASKLLSIAETNYSIIEKMLMCLVFGLNKFHVWLQADKLTVRVSTNDLEKVMSMVNRPDRVELLLLKIPPGFDNFVFEVKKTLLSPTKGKIINHLPQEIFFIDGACRNNGKPDCKAAWAVFAEFEDDLALRGFVENTPSNNAAELMAAIKACEVAKDRGYDAITVVTDSKYLHSAATCHIDK